MSYIDATGPLKYPLMDVKGKYVGSLTVGHKYLIIKEFPKVSGAKTFFLVPYDCFRFEKMVRMQSSGCYYIFTSLLYGVPMYLFLEEVLEYIEYELEDN